MLKKCIKCNKIYNSNLYNECNNCLNNQNKSLNKHQITNQNINNQNSELLSRVLNIRSRRKIQQQNIQKIQNEKKFKLFSNNLTNENKQEKVLRKQNKKLRKVELKEKKLELKENKNQELLQKIKYEEAQKALYTYEIEVKNELNALNNQREILINKIEETLESESLIVLQKTFLTLKSQEETIISESKKNNEDLKNLKIKIENFNISKLNPQTLNVFANLRKEYFLSTDEQFDEIINNQLTYNQPKTNEAIKKQINSMKMNQEYLNFWINVSENDVKPCPGGCTARFSGGKRLFRTVEFAQQSAYNGQYTYIDSPCKKGFHNASRHEISVSKDIIENWVAVFELQDKYLKLQNLESNKKVEYREIEIKLKNVQKDMFTFNEQNEQIKINLDDIDTKINKVETKFNEFKKLFLMKEEKYFSTGLFEDISF